MKKVLLMFVMLLGSVATMQAQSNTTFDFSCTQASDDFTGAQIDLLAADSFTEVSPSIFQIASEDGLYSVRVESDGGSILVYIVGVGMITPDGDTLADAIAAAIAAAAVTNPDADNDGFLDSEEAGELSDYGHLPNGGFTQEENGGYRLNGPEGYYVAITVLDGVYTMTEVGGSNTTYPVWPNVDYPEALLLSDAITYAVSYYSAHVGYTR